MSCRSGVTGLSRGWGRGWGDWADVVRIGELLVGSLRRGRATAVLVVTRMAGAALKRARVPGHIVAFDDSCRAADLKHCGVTRRTASDHG
jgi:hypothetical protein